MVNYYNASINNAKLGDAQVVKMCYGDEVVWQHAQPVTGDYFATVAMSNGTIKFNGSSSNTLSYSTDNGATWSTASKTPSVNVNAGDKVLWKGECMPNSSDGIGNFNNMGTATFDVEGNAMSLLFGDDFSGQTSLTGKNFAFYGLFRGNTKVISAENLSLPATTLATGCYSYMFYGCTSLTSAPELPATALTSSCYDFMFKGCTSLTTAPELPAETLAQWCYWGMFYGCTSLTEAPELPATTLAPECYDQMFQDCIGLTTAPELPATTLAGSCYSSMFGGCTGLTTAPELPATTLARNCYVGMFSRCSSLTTAPELPAPILTEGCYGYLFCGCTSLNSITCLATDISASTCTYYWVDGVASSGTFTKAAGMTGWTTSVSGIPEGWTVDEPANTKYFTTVATSNGRIVFSGRTAAIKLQYSKNSGATWSTASQTPSVSVSAGDKVLWKGSKTGLQIGKFTSASTANFNVEGNIMSLIYGDNFATQTTIPDGTSFGWLFDRNTKVISAEKLSLPATTLASMCYMCMFTGCSNLTKAPKLPAKTLTVGCYTSMFQGCTSLTTAPSVLPATTLTDECYNSMFEGCTSLTTAPALPATTLAEQCYRSMFAGCTSLTSAPSVLPAMTLAEQCYLYMFLGCTSLTTAPELPATTLANYCYNSMFEGCTSLTTAPSVLPAKTLTEESYNQMFSGCTSLTTSPVLPDAKMAKDCYAYMFNGCTSLNSITCLAHEPDAVYNVSTDWVSNVAATGTFAKYPLATWTTGDNAMPNGWTAVNAEYPKYQAVIAGQSYSAQCDGATTITSSTTKPAGYNVSDITSAEIGPCITSIGDYAFDGCGSLSSVYVPSSIVSIGQYAFRGCSSLPEVVISDSITSIGNGAYQGCTGLNRIVVDATVPPTIGSNVFSSTNNCPIIVSCDSLEAYRQAWAEYADRIDCSSEFAGKCMLLDDGGVEHTFDCNGDTVIHEGEYNDVFDNYTITVVMIGSCCTEIEMGAFDSKRFGDLTIGSNVQSIGDWAFGFSNLEEVHVLATTPPTIGSDPFAGFYGTIYVPAGTAEAYRQAWPDYSDKIVEEGSSQGA